MAAPFVFWATGRLPRPVLGAECQDVLPIPEGLASGESAYKHLNTRIGDLSGGLMESPWRFEILLGVSFNDGELGV